MDTTSLTLPDGATVEVIQDVAGQLPAGATAGAGFSFPGLGNVTAVFFADTPEPGDATAHLIGLPKGETHLHEHEYRLTADEARTATSPVDAWLGAFVDSRLSDSVLRPIAECMARWQAEAAAAGKRGTAA